MTLTRSTAMSRSDRPRATFVFMRRVLIYVGVVTLCALAFAGILILGYLGALALADVLG